MNDKKAIYVMRVALKTIAHESKEPHIKMYAQNALEETKPSVDPDAFCTTHKWFGQHGERCPICKKKQKIR